MWSEIHNRVRPQRPNLLSSCIRILDYLVEKIEKSSQTSPFSFLLQLLDYYMMIFELSIYRKEIERDRLEIMSMTPKGVLNEWNWDMDGI